MPTRKDSRAWTNMSMVTGHNVLGMFFGYRMLIPGGMNGNHMYIVLASLP